jgi:tRNA-Thr(GGU) m(6)t(6)A37 methyltransferase TsaA
MQNPTDAVTFRPIGVIHSPHQELAGMPVQPTGAKGVQGWIEVAPAFAPGLQDLEGFSHVILLYHLHKAAPAKLVVTPFLDDQPRGVFATRAPTRPNPIGLSVVELVGREGAVLHITNVDILDGTPLLDIKPFVGAFDQPENPRIGWFERSRGQFDGMRSDDRFT